MASPGGVLLSVLVVIGSCLAGPSLAAVYTVGGPNGWAMGVDYSTWAAGRTFSVGDTLVFNYGGGHTVDEVTESDYKACAVGSSITTDSSGATAITLATPGSHYFICRAAGHCGFGMKLAVNVAGAARGSSGQPPLLSSDALPPASGSGLPLPPLGSGVALPPAFGLRSLTPSIAGSGNAGGESLEPSASSALLPDFSSASAVAGSALWAVFVAGASMFVFRLF